MNIFFNLIGGFSMTNPVPPQDITSDDKLWSMLGYILTPLVPIIVLFMEDKKKRPFIKAHNMQALVLGVIEYVVSFVLSFVVVGCFVGVAALVVNIIYGLKANKGEVFDIPVISNFIKNQGWNK
jgi:uncharacterized protein